MTLPEKHEIPPNGGLVEVIVPVYNMEDYLPKCLDSILTQSYSNLDIITVNDGSIDSSMNILENYAQKDSRIRVISQANGGLSAARNTGLESLKPETQYVTFVDSDDWLADNAISSMYTCLEERQADMVIGLYDKITPEGKQLYICREDHYNDDDVISKSQMFDIQTRSISSKYTFAWGKLYRRHVIEDLLFPLGKVYEDSICHRIYGKCNRIAFLNEVVYHYLKRPGSIVRSGYDIRRLDKVEILVDRIQYLREEGFPQYSTRCLMQTYVLMREVLTRIPQLDTAIRERVKNLRRLLGIEYKKTSFAGLSLKERATYWANNYLFWLLYYRWKHRYSRTRDKIQ